MNNSFDEGVLPVKFISHSSAALCDRMGSMVKFTGMALVYWQSYFQRLTFHGLTE